MFANGPFFIYCLNCDALDYVPEYSLCNLQTENRIKVLYNVILIDTLASPLKA